jgi:ubiquitin-like protein Pup
VADGGRQQQKKQHKHEAPAEQDKATAADKAEELKEDIDDLLDEIDEVLEQNAEEFVRGFVQKGGE